MTNPANQKANPKTVAAAIAIHQQLVGKPQKTDSISLPTYAWTSILHLQQQIEKARQWGWHDAAKRLSEYLSCALSDCRGGLDETIRRLLAANRTPCHKVSVADVYRDLRALESEFEDVEIDLKAHEVAVTTDAITLEDVLLGRFEIRLNWKDIGRMRQPYRVIALDPHPSSRRSDIAHPHVQDNCLCEGDGIAAIAAALAEGRLFDFFEVVSQVLHTYGRGSAYVELDDWHASPCSDCGEPVDECYSCDRCDNVLCGDCTCCCGYCNSSYCSECSGTCSVCRKTYCSSCLETCQACRGQVCDDCRKESGLCRPCHDKQHKELEHEHEATEDDLQPERASAAA